MKRFLIAALALAWSCCAVNAQFGCGPMAPCVGPPSPYPNAYSKAPSLVIYGDSIANNAGDSASLQAACNQFCGTAISGNYFTWTMIESGFRVSRPTFSFPGGSITNCGVNGQTVGQILGNISCVIAAKPDIVIVEGGGNDAATNVACATTTANNRAIYSQLLALGITVIKVSVYPRSSPSTFTTAQANLAQCYNEYDRRFAEEVGQRNFYFVDLDSVVIDPAQPTTWSIRSGYLVDGAHPSTAAAFLMAAPIAAIINSLVPQWRQPIFTNGDTYDATNNPTGNLLPDGLMQGTSGGLNGTCPGTIAGNNSSQVAVIAGGIGGATCAASTTVLSDGRTAQVVTVSGAATGNGNSFAVRSSVTTLSNISIGDTIECQGWLSVGANTNLSGVQLNMVSTESGTQFSANVAGPNQADPFPAAGTGGTIVMVTQRRTVTAVPSSLFCDAKVSLLNGSVSPTGALTVTSMSIRKVLQ